MSESELVVLMNRARISRTVRRLAYQIAEAAGDKPLVLVGLNDRGYKLAKMLNEELTRATGDMPPLLQLYRDQVEEKGEQVLRKVDPDGAILILVDDVIFTGETMFDVLRHLPVDRKMAVYVTVLIDRGNRKYPVWARFVGREIPTKIREHVDVELNGETDRVTLFKK